MAFINLLPATVKKIKRPELKKTPGARGLFPSGPAKLPLFWPILAIAGAFLAVLATQAMQFMANKKTFNALEQQVEKIKFGYQKINEITKKKNELNDTFSFIQKLSVMKTLWSDALFTIAELMPAQVWLTDITIDSRPAKELPRGKIEKNEALPTEMAKGLTIKGSATSLVESEIIASITQFVELLKKDALFNKDFTDIKLGQLQSDRKGNLIIMNFVIYCKSDKFL